MIHRERVLEFIGRHSDSAPSLRAWAQHVEQGDFKHFAQLRQTFAAADYVPPHVVFNIAGNKYRLVAIVSYALRAVSVEADLTHAEYDRGKWRC